MSSATSATDVLRAEHRRIEDQLDRLLGLAKHPSRDMGPALAGVFAELNKITRPHFAREEGILYPYLRTLWPDLLADMDEQHQYVREVEHNLDELLVEILEGPSDRQFTELVRFAIELHDTIQHHIVDEEEQLLRLADITLSREEQGSLAMHMADPSPALDPDRQSLARTPEGTARDDGPASNAQ